MEFYHVNKKRFILMVKLHFDTVVNFVNKAGVSRTAFYKVLNKQYKTKNPPSFTRFFNLLNSEVEDGKYDYDLFVRRY